MERETKKASFGVWGKAKNRSHPMWGPNPDFDTSCSFPAESVGVSFLKRSALESAGNGFRKNGGTCTRRDIGVKLAARITSYPRKSKFLFQCCGIHSDKVPKICMDPLDGGLMNHEGYLRIRIFLDQRPVRRKMFMPFTCLFPW